MNQEVERVPYAKSLYALLSRCSPIVTSLMHELHEDADTVQTGGELGVYNQYFDAGLHLFAELHGFNEDEVEEIEPLYMQAIAKDWERMGYFFVDFSNHEVMEYKLNEQGKWVFSEEGRFVNAPVKNIW